MNLAVSVFRHEGSLLGQILAENGIPSRTGISFVPLTVKGLINFYCSWNEAVEIADTLSSEFPNHGWSVCADQSEAIRGDANQIVNDLEEGATDYSMFDVKSDDKVIAVVLFHDSLKPKGGK
jgi:hypothetical protein